MSIEIMSFSHYVITMFMTVEGTGLNQPKCPPGTYSNRTGLINENECTPCTEGSYCEDAGLHEPTGLCAEGYYCPPGQNSSTPYVCVPGYYCEMGSFNMTKCPGGTYQDELGQGACKECVAGKWCIFAVCHSLLPCSYAPFGAYILCLSCI